MDNYLAKWSRAIANTEFECRDPIWEGAIQFLMSEGVFSGTMARKLSQGMIQDIIFDSSDVSIYDMFIDMVAWISKDDVVESYLLLYFSDGNEIWLAYLMAVYYGMFWDGEQWKVIEEV